MDRLAMRTEALPRSPALRVLASGSAGNCAVLSTPAGLTLIDIGLSPRRTLRLLRDASRTRRSEDQHDNEDQQTTFGIDTIFLY